MKFKKETQLKRMKKENIEKYLNELHAAYFDFQCSSETIDWEKSYEFEVAFNTVNRVLMSK